ncbi:hypothetical protein BTH42_11185 [Burkholderia sp. SRS-W-2-2016]|nr:hypothetical protein BTH42_11185 [Burkholderia sp. SRS-W-2-2016]
MFRLVFSWCRGVLVAVAETAIAHGRAIQGETHPSPSRHPITLFAMRHAAFAALILAGFAPAFSNEQIVHSGAHVKPDPVPAGVTTPYAYEITEGGAGDITQMDSRMLTFNFSTTQPVTGTPALELATVTAAGVTYSPTVAGPLMAAGPNYSVAGSPNQVGCTWFA